MCSAVGQRETLRQKLKNQLKRQRAGLEEDDGGSIEETATGNSAQNVSSLKKNSNKSLVVSKVISHKSELTTIKTNEDSQIMSSDKDEADGGSSDIEMHELPKPISLDTATTANDGWLTL